MPPRTHGRARRACTRATLAAIVALCTSLCMAAWLTTSIAHAQLSTREQEARRLFEQGVAASDEQRWADAEQSFMRSHALVPASTTLLNLALVRYELGDAVRALQAVDELESQLAQDEVRTRAEALRNLLEPLVGRVTLQLDVPSARVELDGRELPGDGAVRPLVLTPGRHALHVTSAGHAPSTLELDVQAGMREVKDLHLTPLPSAVPVVSTVPTAEDAARSSELDPTHEPPSAPARPERRLVRNPWLWSAVGVAVVGGLTTALWLSSDDAGTRSTAGIGGSQRDTLNP